MTAAEMGNPISHFPIDETALEAELSGMSDAQVLRIVARRTDLLEATLKTLDLAEAEAVYRGLLPPNEKSRP